MTKQKDWKPHDHNHRDGVSSDTIRQLALDVQMSIAKLDPLQETLKHVEKLCERITGVSYCIDLDERRKTYQQKRQQETKQAVPVGTQKKKRKRGRPKGSRNRNPANNPLRKQIDASFRVSLGTNPLRESAYHRP